MPAIKPHSEYKKKFRWHDSVKSASFTPTKQQSAVTAGLSSFDSAKTFSKIREPALQHKKRPIDNPYKTYITHILPEALTEHEELQPAPVKSALLQTHKVPAPRKTIDETNNINNNSKTRVLNSKQDKENSLPSNTQRVRKSTNRDDAAVNNRETNTEKHKNEVNRAMQFQAGIRAPKSGGPKFNTEYQRQFAWKKPVIKESPLIAAEQMVYNSNTNIAPYVSDKIQRNSEYQNQFKPWKIRSPYRHKENLTKIAEREIKAKYKLRNKKKKKRLSPEKMAAAGVPSTLIHEDPSLLKRAQNPQAPFFPHASIKKWKSEYKSNFKAPSKFNYTQGVWKGADPPQIQPRDDSSLTSKEDKKDTNNPIKGKVDKEEDNQAVEDSNCPNWFNEVTELRNRAKEYKKRARGTHFSREHLAQLLAEQAKLWDQISNGGDDEDQKHANANEKTKVPAGKPSSRGLTPHVPTNKEVKQSPVRRQLAWTENDNNDNNNNDNNSSIGSIPTPDHIGDSVSSSTNPEIVDENGRVPTPELPDKGIKQRHHFDRTTPYTGGALLTSPQPKRKSASPCPVHGHQLADEPIYKPSNRQYAIDKSPSRYTTGQNNVNNDSSDECDDDDNTPVKKSTYQSKTIKPQAGSPTAGVRSRDPDPLNDDLSEHSFNRHSKNFYQTSPTIKYIPGTASPPRTWAAPRHGPKDQARLKTSGGPLDRPHTENMQGRPLTAKPMTRKQAQAESLPSDDASSISSARQAREKLAAKSNKPKHSPAWTIPVNDDIHPSVGVSKLDSPPSDQMSVSAISSVSSCSLASDILDRARKRRDHFWSK